MSAARSGLIFGRPAEAPEERRAGSDGSTVALGSFTVAAGNTETQVQFGDSGTPFPANFDPFDIATITVSNASNVAVFQTDLTNLPSLTSMNFNASLKATAGT